MGAYISSSLCGKRESGSDDEAALPAEDAECCVCYVVLHLDDRQVGLLAPCGHTRRRICKSCVYMLVDQGIGSCAGLCTPECRRLIEYVMALFM